MAGERMYPVVKPQTRTLVNSLSASTIVAEAAGTRQPVWDKRTTRPTARRYVDFPEEFGPVSSCSVVGDAKVASLGQNAEASSCSTTG